ncbi:MAG: double-strand break repair protein AddB, partial [Hyphomicrobium sp.]
ELGGFPDDAVDGLSKLDCPSPREEAEAIALIMREALDVPERTCALVTPDRRLAGRVARELSRWQIDVDDSGGAPLGQTPPGTFLRLTANMVAEAFAPVATLAVCKHPLAAAGMNAAAFRSLSRRAELALLRGPKPPEGLDGLRRLIDAAKTHRSELGAWLNRLSECCKGFEQAMTAETSPMSSLLGAHLAATEALAATNDGSGASRLWSGDAGEAAASFMSELAESCDTLGPIAPAVYPALLDALMAGLVVRPRFGRHPRLSILGPLEARLQRFDVIVLGALNEGTWPTESAADPWMSRPMRQAFGLPSPEERIALAAHDVSQALSAPRVILTRALKVDGTPTVPSRWLRRLERAIDAAGLKDAFERDPAPWLSWAKALSAPGRPTTIGPPAPRPPVAARPRRLSVTQIEKWMRDPYSIFARHVLKLEALDPLEQDASIADYGIVVHHALQRFVERHPTGSLPHDAYAQLCAIGRERFAEEAVRPSVMAFWWPRFERIAAWFLRTEDARRGDIAQSHAEVKGVMTLTGRAGPFALTARADRIDRLTTGRLVIIDYKTGATPPNKEVYAGYAPQLPLEAAMARAGAFENIAAAEVDALCYWRMHGRDDGGKATALTGDVAAVADTARAGLERLIAAFDDPATGYAARPDPELAPAYSDYLHLARVKEWSAAEDEE